jgi:hypothetical protein
MLIFFIADLLRDPDKQARFLEDPVALLSENGLSEEQQAIILSRNSELLARAVSQELLTTTLSGPVVLWPGPVLHLTAISPDRGGRGRVLKTRLTGTWFEQSLRVSLTLGATSVHGDVRGVTRYDNGSSHASVEFTLGSELPTGRYTVVGTQQSGNGLTQKSTLDEAFTLE